MTRWTSPLFDTFGLLSFRAPAGSVARNRPDAFCESRPRRFDDDRAIGRRARRDPA